MKRGRYFYDTYIRSGTALGCLGRWLPTVVLFLCFSLHSDVAFTQATDLIISEYVEGSSNNKYIELYNGTSGSINLADYRLRLYANGINSPTNDVLLSGTLAAGATIVYKNSSASLYGGATTSNAACNFTGNDAVALYKISTASNVDIFGNIGCDPGTAWTSGFYTTMDRTLVRNANICTGVTVNPGGSCPFPTLASEWTQYVLDDVSNLGSHTMTCGPTVNFSTPTGSTVESVTPVTVNLTISPATTSAGTISITIAGGTATYGSDYTTTPAAVSSVITVNVPLGATTASFDLNVVDDAFTEANETINLSITGATGGIYVGGAISYVHTIIDNDATPTIDFTTLNRSVLENAGTVTFSLGFLPTTHPSGSLTIQITPGPGPGATYTSDYTTNPVGGGGTFTFTFSPNVASVSFSATIIDDLLAEPTETVTFTIVGVPAGFAIGGNNSATLVISDNDSPPTVLTAGDLVVVGVNANEYACGGGTGEDRISFFCFQEIVFGTEIILTDNGYERCLPGKWGNGEGTVRMKRIGPAIPAGQVITFKVSTSAGPSNVQAMAPDVQWSCTYLNYPSGSMTGFLNMNNGGDQLFFMQGGTWNSGTSGNSDATYNGTILYAFSTNPSPPWTASCSTNPTQRSNLPPGMECFSTSPTLATDFNKYIGPTSAATQRDWIMRVDDVTNWNSYGSCSAYNSSGYNWLTAPILPILPGGMTNGLWRGAKNTDWFECKNWDDAQIPIATTNVVINASAVRSCDVGLSPGVNPGGTGVCASVNQTLTSSAWTLTVQPNSTLTVGGLFKLQNASSPSTVLDRVLANGTLNAASVQILGYTPGSFNAYLQSNAVGSSVNVTGNLTIGNGGALNLQNTLGASGTLRLGGNFINQETETHFLEGFSSVILNGGANQQILNTDPAEKFYDLKVGKTGGDVTLNAPIAITHQLDLTQGRIISTAANLPTLNTGATAINASNASFVSGPLQRTGSLDFTFPIGKGNYYRPASVRNLTGSGTFTGEYFDVDPYLAIAPLVQPTALHHMSHCEYWMINRTGSSPNAQVALTWDTPSSCGVTTGALSDLRVVRWNGTIWDNRGNGGTSGSAAAGEVLTAAVEPAFSPWTLASITASNPLPIELLSFTATPVNDQVALHWSTASEKENDHFTVERSNDAIAFAGILTMPGAGNSQSLLQYGDVDTSPLDGLSYYRLRQTDINGTSTVSETVPVFFQSKSGMPLTVLYGPDGAMLLHDFPAGSTLEILDLTGRTINSSTIPLKGLTTIPMHGLSHGVYVLRLTDAARTESTRLAY